MQTALWSIAAALAVAAFVLSSRPAAASPPTCEQLVAARGADQSSQDVAKRFGTTRARVESCIRMEEQHQRLSAEHARFAQRRTERGLPTP